MSDTKIKTSNIEPLQITHALLHTDMDLTGKTVQIAAPSGNTHPATKLYVDTAVANLVDSAPTSLDTLNELAAALNDDASFSTTVTTSLATKAPTSTTLTAGTGLTGGGDLSANRTFALDTSGVSAATYGSSSAIPSVVVDTYGRITSASATTIGGSITGTFDDLKLQYGTSYSGTPAQGSFFFDSLNQRLKIYTGSTFVDATPTGGLGYLALSGGTMTGNIAKAGDFTLDAGGDLILDADGAQIRLKDNGVEFGVLSHETPNLIIKSQVSNGDIVFKANDGGSTITTMTIKGDGGNVGIGTTSPVYTLTVSEDGNDNIEIGAGIIQRYNRGSSSYGNLTYYGAAHNIISLSNDIKLESRSSDTSFNSGVTAKIELDTVGTGYGQIRMSTGGGGGGINTDALVISPTGNVGIGTASPSFGTTSSAGLEIAHATRGIIRLEGNNQAQALELYGDSTGGTIDARGSGAVLQFDLGGSEKMRIESTGRVAIGRSSSYQSAKVTIENNAHGNYLYMGGSTENNRGLLFTSSVGSTGAAYLGAKHTILAQSGGGEIEIKNDGYTWLFLGPTGNVGIGETSPSRLLHIQAKGTSTVDNAAILLENEVGTTAEIRQGPASDNALIFTENGAERLRITSGGNVGVGTASPSQILHINSPTPHVRIVNSTNTSYSGGTSKISMDNPSAGSSARGMISETLYTWTQTTADSWILVRTPQAYADQQAGGWAEFKLAWTGYHASNNTLMFWTAVFHNNHGRVFSWSKTAVTQVGNGTGSYGPYNYTPAVAFYKQTSAGGGYNTNDSWMRNLYIKVSGRAASNVCAKRSLYIKGLSGGFDYEVAHAGTSTPAGGLTSV